MRVNSPLPCALAVSLAFAACGDSGTAGTTSTTAQGTTASSTDPTTAAASEATTDTSTTAPTSGSSAGLTDSSTTGPDLPSGMCLDENHGSYWCECAWQSTQACERDGVMTCFWENEQVISHFRWGPCSECAPGTERVCDKDGAPGRQFCNVAHDQVADIEELPTPIWGICLLEDEIVCTPGQDTMCGMNTVQCDVDEDGVPFKLDC